MSDQPQDPFTDTPPVVDREGNTITTPSGMDPSDFDPEDMGAGEPDPATYDAELAGRPDTEPREAVDPVEAAEGAEDPAQAAAEATATPEEGTPGRGPGPRGGKGEMRRYKLLYQTAPDQWTEFALDPTSEEQKQHTAIVTSDGSTWMMCRNNEHAKRVGYAILGSPREGVTIFPIPQGAFKPSRVKPAPQAPVRERLVFE